MKIGSGDYIVGVGYTDGDSTITISNILGKGYKTHENSIPSGVVTCASNAFAVAEPPNVNHANVVVPKAINVNATVKIDNNNLFLNFLIFKSP